MTPIQMHCVSVEKAQIFVALSRLPMQRPTFATPIGRVVNCELHAKAPDPYLAQRPWLFQPADNYMLHRANKLCARRVPPLQPPWAEQCTLHCMPSQPRMPTCPFSQAAWLSSTTLTIPPHLTCRRPTADLLLTAQR